ncbi:unnamed protein product, partial [Notodromas monacha]
MGFNRGVKRHAGPIHDFRACKIQKTFYDQYLSSRHHGQHVEPSARYEGFGHCPACTGRVMSYSRTPISKLPVIIATPFTPFMTHSKKCFLSLFVVVERYLRENGTKGFLELEFNITMIISQDFYNTNPRADAISDMNNEKTRVHD